MPEREPAEAGSEAPIYGPYGASGGGGQGGNYVFADLAELQSMITRWEAIRDRIGPQGDEISQAIRELRAPARDDPSVLQANSLTESLQAAYDHNRAMHTYADTYIEKLKAARNEYTGTDQEHANEMESVDQR